MIKYINVYYIHRAAFDAEPIFLHRISTFHIYINIIIICHGVNAFIDNRNGLTNKYFREIHFKCPIGTM